LAVWVGVPPDKILKDEFGVFEVWRLVVIGLSMNSVECFLVILEPPDEALDIFISPSNSS
jgi:hypothetical protein